MLHVSIHINHVSSFFSYLLKKPSTKLRPKQKEYRCSYSKDVISLKGKDFPFHHLTCLSSTLYICMCGCTPQQSARSAPLCRCPHSWVSAAADTPAGQGTDTLSPPFQQFRNRLAVADTKLHSSITPFW